MNSDKGARRYRSKNLTRGDVDEIVRIIDSCEGKISWRWVLENTETRLFRPYTRQTLFKHERIRRAYEVRKGSEAGVKSGSSSRSLEVGLLLQRIEQLRRENERLVAENNSLLEQFARWAYNAHGRGLDEHFLNQPLPPVSRGRTDRK